MPTDKNPFASAAPSLVRPGYTSYSILGTRRMAPRQSCWPTRARLGSCGYRRQWSDGAHHVARLQQQTPSPNLSPSPNPSPSQQPVWPRSYQPRRLQPGWLPSTWPCNRSGAPSLTAHRQKRYRRSSVCKWVRAPPRRMQTEVTQQPRNQPMPRLPPPLPPRRVHVASAPHPCAAQYAHPSERFPPRPRRLGRSPRRGVRRCCLKDAV